MALTASAATIGVDQLKQLGVDGLPGLLQDPNQVPGLPQVPRCEEGVGGALVGAAGCTTNTVDVVLGRVGIVVVDDELDIFHIFFWGKTATILSTEGKR